jgi:uncharacterized membrane protein YwaF
MLKNGKEKSFMKEEKLIKLSKIFLLTYMILTFVSILLPDELVIGITKLDYRIDPFQMIMRWLQFVGFLVLPVAVYFDKPTFKKLAVYFCLPVAIIFMFLFKDMLPGFTSELGTGIASIRYLPEFISDFMRNGVVRTIIFFVMMLSELATIALIILRDKSFLKFMKQDIMPFIVLLVALTVSIVPIYAPEAIFDHQSNIDFTMFSVAHIAWMALIVGESIILHKIFKNKDYDSKYILVLILSLCLLVQYNQMFSSQGELNCKRMPLQLCNLAAYLTLVSVVFKNRKVFLFNILVNVAGAIIAVLILDGDNSGVISKGNMHYIVEHHNIIITPILCLNLGIFDPIKKGEFKSFVKYFTIYFIAVLIIGTIFNGLAVALDSNWFKCNYLFMFDQAKAKKLIKIAGALFEPSIKIGYFTLYPIIQITIYVVFSLIGYLSYVIFRKTVK